MSDYERIEKVLRYLEANYLSQPALKDLAKVAGLSESHFQRLFNRWAGTTPKSYLQYLTANRAKQLLLESKDLLTTSLNSGLSGPSRLHDLMISVEAMTPGEFKAKGQGVEIRYGFHETPFGDCLIGITQRGICHLSFLEASREVDESKALNELKADWPRATLKPAKIETAKTIQSIFGPPGKRKIALLIKGTPFQIKVWEGLLRVPEGALVSYSNLAEFVGSSKASRAVGSAVGRNSIAYLIPCHRVIRETGVIGDYRWGSSRKRALLAWEQLRKGGKGKDTPHY